MDNEAVYAAIKDSIGNSLAQLGRGSGITPEQRANMIMVIAHPLAFIVEEAIHEAIESLVAENARLTLAVTNAKLEFDAIWRAVQVGSGHDDAAAANEAGRVAENASRMMARALGGD